MAARGGGRGDGRRRGGVALLLAASARLYGALLVLYPKAFRRRYSAEMRLDFRELSREGLREGGATGLARVWTRALSDLMITALKERSTMPAARNAYFSSSVDPRIAAKAITASLLAAGVVAVASLWQTPTYEASVQMWVNFQKLDDLPLRTAGGFEGVRELTQLMALVIDTRPNAKETVRRLGLEMSPDELLGNLTVEQVDGTNLLRLTYEGTNPEQAARIAGTLAEVASEQPVKVSPRGGGSKLTAIVYEKASVPDAPASPKPLRNGLIALVVALAPLAVLFEARSRRMFGG